MSAIPAKNRALVASRSGGMCEGCGLRRATDVHHRQYKSRGGTHAVSNLMALCGGTGGLSGGNHSGCHGVAHSREGEDRGWSIRSGFDPLSWPARRWFTGDYGIRTLGWVLLDDAGHVLEITEDEAARRMKGMMPDG